MDSPGRRVRLAIRRSRRSRRSSFAFPPGADAIREHQAHARAGGSRGSIFPRNRNEAVGGGGPPLWLAGRSHADRDGEPRFRSGRSRSLRRQPLGVRDFLPREAPLLSRGLGRVHLRTGLCQQRLQLSALLLLAPHWKTAAAISRRPERPVRGCPRPDPDRGRGESHG